MGFLEEDTREIDELLLNAAQMQCGPTQIGLLEEAVRRADLLGNESIAYDARHRLMRAAGFGGRPDVLLVAFARCMAYADAHPERCNEQELLWRYKWIINRLCEFPSISRTQISAAFDDFCARTERAGYSNYAAETLRLRIALTDRNVSKAKTAYANLLTARRDAMGDCPACVADLYVQCQILAGDYERAIQVAEPIRAGRLRCTEIPHITFARLLLPLFRLGRIEEALECQRRGYRLIQRNPNFLTAVSEHIVFLTLIGDQAKAKRLFAKHLAWLEIATNSHARMFFYLSGVSLFKSLREAARRPFKLRLPPTAPAVRSSGLYSPLEAFDWAYQSARALAEQFDERDSGSKYRELLKDYENLTVEIRAFPVSSDSDG
jgi:tetratricopeptide (TPR) repeat protein